MRGVTRQLTTVLLAAFGGLAMTAISPAQDRLPSPVSKARESLLIDVTKPPKGLRPAVPNDGRDDSAAFQQMINYLYAQTKQFATRSWGEVGTPSGALFIPEGVYDFDKKVIIAQEYFGLTLYGASEERTILKCNNGDGILDITWSGPSVSRLKISNLTFAAGIENAGTALSVQNIRRGVSCRGVSLSHMTIKGSDFDAGRKNWFTMGVYARNFFRTLFDNVKFFGPASDSGATDAQKVFSPRVAVVVDCCHTPEVSNCVFDAVDTGLIIRETSPCWDEAGIVFNNRISSCRQGIFVDYLKGGATVGLCISHCDISAIEQGIRCENRRGTTFTDNIIRRLPSKASKYFVGINMRGLEQVMCADNRFDAPQSDAGYNAIAVDHAITEITPKGGGKEAAYTRDVKGGDILIHSNIFPVNQDKSVAILTAPTLSMIARNTYNAGPKNPPEANAAYGVSPTPVDAAINPFGGTSYLDVTNPPAGIAPAIPNDGKDDTEAFQKCLDWAVRNKKGTIIVPPGVYEISSTLSVDAGALDLSVIGCGPFTTTLAWKIEKGDGFSIKTSDPGSRVVLRSFTCLPRASIVGAAIRVEQKARAANEFSSAALVDVQIEASAASSEKAPGGAAPPRFFSAGLSVQGANKPFLSSVVVRGYTIDKALRKKAAYRDIRKDRGCGIFLENCPDAWIAATYVWEYAEGFRLRSCSGFTLVSSTGVSCDYGLISEGSPKGHTRLCHFNCYQRDILAQDSHESCIEDDLLYFCGGETESGEQSVAGTPSYRDIELLRSGATLIQRNIIWRGGLAWDAIQIDAQSGGAIVKGNMFNHGSDNGPVRFSASSPNSIVGMNHYGVYLPDDANGDYQPVFGYWRMDEVRRTGSRDCVPDFAPFSPTRNNNLLVSGVSQANGPAIYWRPKGNEYKAQDFGKSIAFGANSRAVAEKPWMGGTSIRFELYVRFHSSKPASAAQTLVACPNVFSAQMKGDTIVFACHDNKGQAPCLLELKRARQRSESIWFFIYGEFNPGEGKQVLGYSAFSDKGNLTERDAVCRSVVGKGLRSVKAPVSIGALDAAGASPLNGDVANCVIYGP